MSVGLVVLALALAGVAGWIVVRPRRVRPPRTPIRASLTGRCALYVIPSPGPRPLRVGITCDPARRFREYARTAPWWGWRAADPYVTWYPTRAEALAAERQAIHHLAPLYNDHHNLGRGHVLVARRVEPRHVPATGVRWSARPRGTQLRGALDVD